MRCSWFFCEICGFFVCRGFAFVAQETPAPSATPAVDETIQPTFETQKLARTYVLDIPAPRGQITDRNGEPLAQNKLGYTLSITYPTPLDFSDAQVLAFAQEKIGKAEKFLGRKLKISDELILRHYHNRGVLPFEIAQSLTTSEKDDLKGVEGMIVRPIYLRSYPNGSLAGQVIGYTGKKGRLTVSSRITKVCGRTRKDAKGSSRRSTTC